MQLKDETGAVTVDWVVLTAALVGLGLAMMSVVSGGTEDLANDIKAEMTGYTITTGFASAGDDAPALVDLASSQHAYYEIPVCGDGQSYNPSLSASATEQGCTITWFAMSSDYVLDDGATLNVISHIDINGGNHTYGSLNRIYRQEPGGNTWTLVSRDAADLPAEVAPRVESDAMAWDHTQYFVGGF